MQPVFNHSVQDKCAELQNFKMEAADIFITIIRCQATQKSFFYGVLCHGVTDIYISVVLPPLFPLMLTNILVAMHR